MTASRKGVVKGCLPVKRYAIMGADGGMALMSAQDNTVVSSPEEGEAELGRIPHAETLNAIAPPRASNGSGRASADRGEDGAAVVSSCTQLNSLGPLGENPGPLSSEARGLGGRRFVWHGKLVVCVRRGTIARRRGNGRRVRARHRLSAAAQLHVVRPEPREQPRGVGRRQSEQQ